MATKIFVNLPARDLGGSVEFFPKLGFTFDQQFTDDTPPAMDISDDMYIMPLTEPKFKTFTPKEACNAIKSTELLIALSRDSREQVDEMVLKAVAAGGSKYSEPQDHGFMSGHGFQGLDDHIWEGAHIHGAQRNKPGLERLTQRLRGCHD
jgi:predicted lactoylglutathione lyase